MNRDLSYRVWDDEKKEYSDKTFSLDQYGLLYIQDDDGYWEEASDRYIIEFSTGLEDRNGKKIYEGDVVRVYEFDKKSLKEAYKYTTDIRWNNRSAMFWTSHADSLCDEITEDHYEIIGNVHESGDVYGANNNE